MLAGAGKAFSAGADLEWMKRGAALGRDDILRESRALHEMLLAIDRLPQAVIGRVQGAAIAGGVGLVSVCDAVVAADGAMFGFSEVRLGIVPAIISPFVMAKIGASAARELFVTGDRFDAQRARDLGLVHRVVEPDGLDWAVGQYVQQILGCAPGAVAAAKALLRGVAGRTARDGVRGDRRGDRGAADVGRRKSRRGGIPRQTSTALGRIGTESSRCLRQDESGLSAVRERRGVDWRFGWRAPGRRSRLVRATPPAPRPRPWRS